MPSPIIAGEGMYLIDDDDSKLTKKRQRLNGLVWERNDSSNPVFKLDVDTFPLLEASIVFFA